jgi:hypothetical protein
MVASHGKITMGSASSPAYLGNWYVEQARGSVGGKAASR